MSKLIGKLTERESLALENIDICKRAVSTVVKEAIREYEDATRIHTEVWRQIVRKYLGEHASSDEAARLEYNHATKELSLLNAAELAEKKLRRRFAQGFAKDITSEVEEMLGND